jgi:hypothetical protein
VSGEPSPGVVFDLPSAPVPSQEGGAWGSLREVGGWWGALRLLPSAIRQVFSEREPVGGLPVVEPGHTRPAELPEVDFNPGAPIADHTPAAQTPASEAHAAEPPEAGFTAEQALAEAATAEAAEAAAEAVQEFVAEVAEVADVAEVAEACVGEVGAELGEAGLEAGL